MVVVITYHDVIAEDVLIGSVNTNCSVWDFFKTTIFADFVFKFDIGTVEAIKLFEEPLTECFIIGVFTISWLLDEVGNCTVNLFARS